ncbi:MAG TPA: hypothetical protein VJ946_05430, partial [Bacteroidales bacterium]|nr:hypothetical protein [Bacteroidales bacterium]
MLLAEVILPVPLPVYYTYTMSESMAKKAQPGSRVIVPLGKSRIHTGIIRRIRQDTKTNRSLKPVLGIPDEIPFVPEENLKLWEWIAFYYHCHVGDVYKAAIPSHFRNFDDVFVRFNQDVDIPEMEKLMPGLEKDNAINLKHLLQTYGNKTTSRLLIEHPNAIESMDYHSHLGQSETILKPKLPVSQLKKERDDLSGSPALKKILDYF